VDDAEPNGRSATTYTIAPLTNDFNPFADQGKPLTVTGVAFQGDPLDASPPTFTASTVSVHTGLAKSGTINLIYTATDAVGRSVQGRVTVTVTSAPDPVTNFGLIGGSHSISVVNFQAPNSNGAPIDPSTGYTVRISGAPADQVINCTPGASCTFTGRTNGTPQTVDISATNNVGTTWSSAVVTTPWGVPAAPTNVHLDVPSSTATAKITPYWSPGADDGGGNVTYNWQFTQGSTAADSTPGTNGADQYVGAGDYAFKVQACNPGGCSAFVTSATITINSPPPARSMTIVKNGLNANNNTKVYVSLSGYAADETVTVTCLATQSGGDGGGTVNLGSLNVTVDGNGAKGSFYMCEYAVGPYAQVRDQYGTHSNVIKVP
jgi:hypothetical protein